MSKLPELDEATQGDNGTVTIPINPHVDN